MLAAPPTMMGWLAALLIASAGLIYWRQRPNAVADLLRVAGDDLHDSPHDKRHNRSQGTLIAPASAATVKHPDEAQEKAAKMATNRLPATTEQNTLIQVDNLTKRYAQPGRAWWSDATVTAVDDLSFSLMNGEAMALWGTNGAGKTTVLKCLLGLLNCEGTLQLNGVDLRKDGRRARRSFGYVPQELAFHNDLSVVESCRFYAQLKDVPYTRIPTVLEEVGLSGQTRKAVGALSGGMKQRLALALALLADPPLLLLDEPTSNLDVETREEFLALLARLHQMGKTLLFTSHHLEEVGQIADRVLILRDGTLFAQGTPTALMPLLNPKRRANPLPSAGLIAQACHNGSLDRAAEPLAPTTLLGER